MTTYKFYSKNGEEFGIEQFVEDYTSSYYLGRPKLVAGVSQNSRVTEDEIVRILRDGIIKEFAIPDNSRFVADRSSHYQARDDYL